jgi:hypothetical protein
MTYLSRVFWYHTLAVAMAVLRSAMKHRGIAVQVVYSSPVMSHGRSIVGQGFLNANDVSVVPFPNSPATA